MKYQYQLPKYSVGSNVSVKVEIWDVVDDDRLRPTAHSIRHGVVTRVDDKFNIDVYNYAWLYEIKFTDCEVNDGVICPEDDIISYDRDKQIDKILC